jgi:hypothetical protein
MQCHGGCILSNVIFFTLNHGLVLVSTPARPSPSWKYGFTPVRILAIAKNPFHILLSIIINDKSK